MFELVLENFVCMFVVVTILHNVLTFCAVSVDSTINGSQTAAKTPTYQDNLCMRASEASDENFCISAFKTCYFFHYVCLYFRYLSV